MNDDGIPITPGDQTAGGQAQAMSDQTQAGGQAQGGGQYADPAAQQPPASGGQAQNDGQTPVIPSPAQPAGQQAPAADQGAGGQAATGGQAVAADGAKSEESFLRPRPPDTELGIGGVGDFTTSIDVPAHPHTTFDEGYFLKMLSGSISLTKNEKKKIVESLPKLSQFQIDELIKIFEEERRKFAELDDKHQVKIRELQNKQAEDWKDLEMAEQQEGKSEEDAAAAEALKTQLMGGGDTAASNTCEKCQAALDTNGNCPTCSQAQSE